MADLDVIQRELATIRVQLGVLGALPALIERMDQRQVAIEERQIGNAGLLATATANVAALTHEIQGNGGPGIAQRLREVEAMVAPVPAMAADLKGLVTFETIEHVGIRAVLLLLSAGVALVTAILKLSA